MVSQEDYSIDIFTFGSFICAWWSEECVYEGFTLLTRISCNFGRGCKNQKMVIFCTFWTSQSRRKQTMCLSCHPMAHLKYPSTQQQIRCFTKPIINCTFLCQTQPKTRLFFILEKNDWLGIRSQWISILNNHTSFQVKLYIFFNSSQAKNVSSCLSTCLVRCTLLQNIFAQRDRKFVTKWVKKEKVYQSCFFKKISIHVYKCSKKW